MQIRIGSLLAAGLAVLFAGVTGTVAQTPPQWSPISYPSMGTGSAACDHLGGQGDVFCFGLRCSATGGAAEWFTYQVGGDSLEGELRVNLVFDGRSHSTLYMQQADTPSGEWSFSALYDPVRDRSTLTRLKGGGSFYVLVGGVSGAHLSLRGSSKHLDQALAICRRDGGTPAQKKAGNKKAPDSLQFMQSRPGCEATEAEIFETLVEAGYGVGGVNQAIVDWANDGTLRLVERAEEGYRYRLAECEEPKAAAAGDGVGETYPAVVLPLIDEARLLCEGASREAVFDPKALSTKDINSDGVPDYIVKMEHLACPSGFRPFCGARLCEIAYFISAGDGHLSDRMLAYDAFFQDDAIAMPCGGKEKVATIRERGGRIIKTDCR